MYYEYYKIVNVEKITNEIKATACYLDYVGITVLNGVTKIHYNTPLSESNKLILDDIVNIHSPIDTNLNLKKSIEDRIVFGKNLMEEFKLKNINEGIQWYQAIHLHARIRAWQVNLPAELGNAVETVDIMNMILSGDIETTCLSLQYGINDDMNNPTHWISNDRRIWLINKMRDWLGWARI